jgi:four helix bundle protein
MKQFDHERLEVYERALELLTLSHVVVKELPRGHRHLADQLQRASTSVVLDIAEGAGECVGKEKARFYRMARRSATESAAVLDVCSKLDLIDAPRHARGREQLLVRLVSNLGPRREETE